MAAGGRIALGWTIWMQARTSIFVLKLGGLRVRWLAIIADTLQPL